MATDHERHTHLSIILEKFFIFTFHVQFLTLMLSQSIESLILGTIKDQMPGEAFTPA